MDEDETLDEDPTIEHININHHGGVNRIRSMPQNPGVVLTMADTGAVQLFDLSTCYKSMQVNGPRAQPPTKATHTFKGHKEEGYAVDWSGVTVGRAATGDCAGAIHLWNTGANGNGWSVDPVAYTGHRSSVEDLQWSPTEATVFASCSADKSVKIWDSRGRSGPQISFDAHNDDVNVISWNRSVGYLLASGSDDGSFKVSRSNCIYECVDVGACRCGIFVLFVSLMLLWPTLPTTRVPSRQLSGHPMMSQ